MQESANGELLRGNNSCISSGWESAQRGDVVCRSPLALFGSCIYVSVITFNSSSLGSFRKLDLPEAGCNERPHKRKGSRIFAE